MMWESEDISPTNTAGYNSLLSFYEYPPHKPFINSVYQPLRPSHTLSKTVTLPESNRDQLLSGLQSLSLRIKTLENERERAESNLREIADNIQWSSTSRGDSLRTLDKQLKEAEQNFHRLHDQHNGILDMMNECRPRKKRSKCKIKRSSPDSNSFETGTTANSEGRHFHLNINTVPFILGGSTAPSHNVKSNVQNVIALLKNHNHQLCLSSKEYSELLNSNQKSDLSSPSSFYPDHVNKSLPRRPLSASPVRSMRRPITASTKRSCSASRRSQTATISDKHCHSRMKHLRQEFATLAREHKRLNTSRKNARELEIINRRMEIILDQLECLQKQLKVSSRKSSTRAQQEAEKTETPLEILRKTRIIQTILKDQTNQQQYRGRSYRARPNSND
ncbi:unnamed protein product [Rotaria socialis]|uniref:Uncharacterized protein n=1 Tax=Rotaria socialis TaxID=392032 RepID=A0A817TS85_9BILA|nr:unnamed protein product [Rotaria socialis]CAF3326616.1 unnamed protein product [Rotaria socialis]CAF3472254.1 unnamed protein product [Rotaria socialis]CAF3518691.1 unnamed protein product [Rotaria socialis]CAF4119129.1 unnamed protein product [Rotaria socialis]